MAVWEEEGGGHQKIYGDDGSGVTRAILTDDAGKLITSTGGVITPTHSQVNVNGNTVVLAANANRVWALIINDSDTIIYLNLGGAGVANTGIRLNAAGSSFKMSEADGNLYLGPINANHGGGAVNKSLIITEGV